MPWFNHTWVQQQLLKAYKREGKRLYVVVMWYMQARVRVVGKQSK